MSAPTGPDPEAPARLAGRYALGEQLGVGGMARVVAATDVRLGREVAVKVLRPELARDPAFQERFRREAQAAASLSDPTIVSVYDTGEGEDGAPFIVMERVRGRTLSEVLRTEGRLLPQRALEVVADVCGALAVAHGAGIVHRDVKPGNVMLTPRGEVKVMDFGIARAVADSSATMTQTAAVLGTAAYLSPEQARGEHVDARSDVYSSGCLLYELVTGTPPFTGDSALSVAYQHVREDPRPPTEYDETLSPDVDAVVLKAMAKNPVNRYQSASEMREDLLRAARGEPVEATPVLVAGVATTLVPAAPVVPPRPSGPSTVLRAVVYTVLGLLLVLLSAVIALFIQSVLADDSQIVEAPELVGLSQAEAVQELADAGLLVGELTARFADRPPGEVLVQTPVDGIAVQRGGTVDLVVSRGIDLTRMPPVVGLSREEAVARLTELRLVVGDVQVRDGLVPAGLVLEASAPAGRELRASTAVDLVVASGRVEVPDVRGRTQDEAVAALRATGLSVALQAVDDPGPAGIVLDQDRRGDRVDLGSVVTLGISRTPAAPPPSPTPEPAPSSAPPTPAGTPAPTPSG